MIKKIVSLIAIVIVLVSFFISCKNDFPEPQLMEFEKQQVISNYDWKIISPNGNSQNFITKKNKVVFIFKWSQHDESAVKMLDNLNKLYDRYKTKVEFIFVTNDSQLEVREFTSSHNYIFPVFFSLSPMPRPLNLYESQVGCLINKKGRIIVLDKGLVNWNSEKIQLVIDGLLKQ